MILHKIKYKYTRAFSNCYVITTFGSNNKLVELLLILIFCTIIVCMKKFIF